MTESQSKYADIIDRPHHVSAKRAPMPRLNRAAQFSPFAALTGYDDLIQEAARPTSVQLELDESRKEELNAALVRLMQAEEPRRAAFTYFQPDERKSGGRYVTATGCIRRCDALNGVLLLDTGAVIPIDHISEIEAEAAD